jgi:hypothetical protein
MDMYVGYLLFECNFHNIFIYPSDDQGDSLALLLFGVIEEDIQEGIVEFPAHLQPNPNK